MAERANRGQRIARVEQYTDPEGTPDNEPRGCQCRKIKLAVHEAEEAVEVEVGWLDNRCAKQRTHQERQRADRRARHV